VPGEAEAEGVSLVAVEEGHVCLTGGEEAVDETSGEAVYSPKVVQGEEGVVP
jgi:hypothetical protein